MPKTCLDCFNLRAKIPMRRSNRSGEESPLFSKIDFNHAVCWCRAGNLQVSNPRGSALRDRIFKNVFRLPNSVRLAFTEAESCMDYDGGDDADILGDTQPTRGSNKTIHNSEEPDTSADLFSDSFVHGDRSYATITGDVL